MKGEPLTVASYMERLFGDPDWHKIVGRPGVWAYRRSTGEIKQMGEKMTAVVETTEVNLAAGEVKPARLDSIAELVAYYDQLTEAINQAEANRTEVQKKIKAAMGEATVATLGNVPTFTYQLKESWRTADIRKDMPNLVDQYRVRKQVETIDWELFMVHHRDKVKAYQTREFRRVSGTRAARG